jgi:signal transduction histidine kinase
MSMIPHSALPKVFLFTIPSLILLGGLLSLLGGGVAGAAFAVPVSGLSFYVIHLLIKEISIAHEQKCFLDEQLIQSQKLAAIGELSAGIAHEINNPLAIIPGDRMGAVSVRRKRTSSGKHFGNCGLSWGNSASGGKMPRDYAQAA